MQHIKKLLIGRGVFVFPESELPTLCVGIKFETVIHTINIPEPDITFIDAGLVEAGESKINTVFIPNKFRLGLGRTCAALLRACRMDIMCLSVQE